MEDPKGAELFQEVLSKTRIGRIKWEPSASESEYFTVLPGGFTLSIQRSTQQNGWGNDETVFVLVLRDEDRELLQVTTDIDGVTWRELNELYESARRQALNVDAKVDKLLGVLTKL